MADTQTPAPEPTDDDALRQRLLGRIAVAAVVIVGLLGSLAMFDALYTPRSVAPTQVSGLPPVMPAEAPQTTAAPAGDDALKPATGEPAKAAAEPAEPPPEPPSAVAAAPEGTAATGAPPLQPLPQERPLTKPATAKQAVIRPSEPVLPPFATKPDVRREIARAPAPTMVTPHGAPASRPLTQAADRQSYALQLGVFSNLANAEELRAKLELAGIPASIEARVRAGPFANRAEADAARAALRSMGVGEGIMISVKR